MPKDNKTDKPKSELAIAREGKVGKISIDGVIGWDWFGMTFTGFKKAIKDIGKVDIIEIEINSPGGVVTEGQAMINVLREHGATIHTYNVGQAASMGSAILLSGDRVFIPDTSLTFIHKPLNGLIGNADDMRKMADELDTFEGALVNSYKTNFKGDEQGIHDLMASETWYSADEINDKFNNVTVIKSEQAQVAAHGDPLEIFGDIATHKETILDRAVGAVRAKHQGVEPKEVDMTPEEVQAIADKAASDAVEAYKKAEADAKAEAEASEEGTEVDTIAFEGDMTKPEDVQAHADKVAMAELVASADLSTTAGVVAYQKALKKHLNKDDATPAVGSNAAAQEDKLGKGTEAHSEDAVTAASERMINKGK